MLFNINISDFNPISSLRALPYVPIRNIDKLVNEVDNLPDGKFSQGYTVYSIGAAALASLVVSEPIFSLLNRVSSYLSTDTYYLACATTFIGTTILLHPVYEFLHNSFAIDISTVSKGKLLRNKLSRVEINFDRFEKEKIQVEKWVKNQNFVEIKNHLIMKLSSNKNYNDRYSMKGVYHANTFDVFLPLIHNKQILNEFVNALNTEDFANILTAFIKFYTSGVPKKELFNLEQLIVFVLQDEAILDLLDNDFEPVLNKMGNWDQEFVLLEEDVIAEQRQNQAAKYISSLADNLVSIGQRYAKNKIEIPKNFHYLCRAFFKNKSIANDFESLAWAHYKHYLNEIEGFKDISDYFYLTDYKTCMKFAERVLNKHTPSKPIRRIAFLVSLYEHCKMDIEKFQIDKSFAAQFSNFEEKIMELTQTEDYQKLLSIIFDDELQQKKQEELKLFEKRKESVFEKGRGRVSSKRAIS